MSRRTALPGAAELFRSTGEHGSRSVHDRPEVPARRHDAVVGEAPQDHPVEDRALGTTAPSGKAERLLSGQDQDLPRGGVADEALPPRQDAASPRQTARRRPASGTGRPEPTGRERHDEKITVYVSVEELMDLERARLTLRGDHGLAVDRGRIVREALAVVLADLATEGEASTLVQRLRTR